MNYRLIETRYDRRAAVAYADYWAYRRNPDFYDFSALGGDCTNFASQALFAGSRVMNYTPELGWYYVSLDNRAPAWTGVEFFYNFLTTNQGPGPYGREVELSEVRPGDFLQLLFEENRFSHTPVIMSTPPMPTLENVLVAAHSNDCNCRPIATYSYKAIRFIHIEGVRREI